MVLADNAPRIPTAAAHVESWFLRANDPASPRAVWIRSTALVRPSGDGVAEAWCLLFDGDRVGAYRSPTPLSDAHFRGGGDAPVVTRVAGCDLRIDQDGGAATGALKSDAGEVRWDLGFQRVPGSLGEPLCLLPSRRLIDARLPRNKLLTPFPAAAFQGEVRWGDERWDLSGWHGMQGHNWGAANAPEYAWGQCLFLDGSGAPYAMVECASGRIQVGPFTTPILSMLTVRRGAESWRFDGLLDLWRQHPDLRFPAWTLRMTGPAGEALVTMHAKTDRMVCLRYDNPVTDPGLCFNSKTAAVTVRVNPAEGDGFELSSPHGGALEFLRRDEHPAVQPVV